MGASKIIRQAMIERNIGIKELAAMLGIQPQSMSTKLYRDTFSYNEVEKIADFLNCDLVFITRDSSKKFS